MPTITLAARGKDAEPYNKRELSDARCDYERVCPHCESELYARHSAKHKAVAA